MADMVTRTFGSDRMTANARALLSSNQSNFAIINFPGAGNKFYSIGDQFGHSYFRNAPAVSSDRVLMLRDDLDPGEPGRPLEHVDLHFWNIPPGYPTKSPIE